MTATAETRPNESVLLRHDADGVTRLTLNRPEVYNALSLELLTALQDALDGISEDRSVRVVVVEGNGTAFCAGCDFKAMSADDGDEATRHLFDACSRVMLALTRIPQPVIARVHGIAAAAGCQLVATCDLAVAAAEARFATSGINVGLFCSAPSVALTRNVPRKHAMEMLLTGDFIDAERAEEIGLVNRVVPAARLDDAVQELAGKIADKSPLAVAMGKRLFYRQLEAAMEAAYVDANETMTLNRMAEDARAGIDAFVAKRPMPEWKGT